MVLQQNQNVFLFLTQNYVNKYLFTVIKIAEKKALRTISITCWGNRKYLKFSNNCIIS